MVTHSTSLTIYGAIWADELASSRCRACGRVQTLDLRRLAIDGHGQKRLADIPFECECGSLDRDLIATPRLRS
jgi:hypothetical protein